jgi:hypothetical protein
MSKIVRKMSTFYPILTAPAVVWCLQQVHFR